jgi:carboxyl-terminal processing protease
VQEGGIEPDIRVPQLTDPDAAKRAQYQLRESDLRGHLINEVDLEDDALEADRNDDPRFTLTAAQLEEQGVEDFQLDYALRTLRRSSGAVIARRN